MGHEAQGVTPRAMPVYDVRQPCWIHNACNAPQAMLATQDIWEQQWDDTVAQIESQLQEMKVAPVAPALCLGHRTQSPAVLTRRMGPRLSCDPRTKSASWMRSTTANEHP